MTERTPRHLISPLGPNWVGTDSACGLAIGTFHLGFSLGRDSESERDIAQARNPAIAVQSSKGV